MRVVALVRSWVRLWGRREPAGRYTKVRPALEIIGISYILGCPSLPYGRLVDYLFYLR